MKIVYLDIETAPSIGAYFDLWKEGNIVWEEKSWFILSIAHRTEGESKTHCMSIADYPRFKRDREDDSQLVKYIWKLLDEADVVIAHNGKRFDVKKINARFWKHGLGPPSPYKVIDTYVESKKYFAHDTHRLDALARSRGHGGKIPHTGSDLWRGFMAGDRKSISLMKEYNIRDVDILIPVYKDMRPWMKQPFINVYTKENGCPACHKHTVQKRGTEPIGRTSEAIRYYCKCRHWSHGVPYKVKNLILI